MRQTGADRVYICEVVARDDGEETVQVTVRLRPEDRARFERLDR
jgi:hypothetical protein